MFPPLIFVSSAHATLAAPSVAPQIERPARCEPHPLGILRLGRFAIELYPPKPHAIVSKRQQSLKRTHASALCQVGGADNGGQLARGLDVPGTDKLPDYVHAVQKLPDIDHVRGTGEIVP